MEVHKRVLVAGAEGIAKGLLVQVEKGIRITPKGVEYAGKMWGEINDLDRLLLAAYLKKATPEDGISDAEDTLAFIKQAGYVKLSEKQKHILETCSGHHL